MTIDLNKSSLHKMENSSTDNDAVGQYYVPSPISWSNILSRITAKKKNLLMLRNTSNRDDDIVMPTSLSNDENLVREILSRLPVKSLMRFKCVSKHWKSLIQNDQHFCSLHDAQSEKGPHLLLMYPVVSEKCFITVDLLEGEAAVHDSYSRFMLGPIKGLICFVNNSRNAVCIYNLSTTEVTPWICTTIMEQGEKEDENGNIGRRQLPTFEFGFDPVSKEHKVICVSEILNLQVSPEYRLINDVSVCEVLTVGHNIWRRIGKVVPHYTLMGASSYANGSIYWSKVKHHDQGWDDDSKNQVIVAFDVGSEKFRVIPVPNFVWGQLYDEATDIFSFPIVSSFEVGGCITLAYKVSNYMVKLFIFDDRDKEINNSTSAAAAAVSNSVWFEENISLPFQWDTFQEVSFQAIAGTDQIIIMSHTYTSMKNFLSLYSYDQKKKTFKKVKTGEISSLLFPNSSFKITTFAESLLHVGKQQQDSASAG